jgi:hypothetical protein
MMEYLLARGWLVGFYKVIWILESAGGQIIQTKTFKHFHRNAYGLHLQQRQLAQAAFHPQ